MRTRGLRLVPVAAAAWIAAVVVVQLPDAAGGVAAALWTAVLLLLAVCLGRAGHRLRWALAAVCLAMAAATASHVALAQPAREAVAGLAVDGGRAVVVHATVVGKAERTAAGDIAFDAQAHVIQIGPRRHAVAIPVAIRVASARPDVGAEVIAEGTAVRMEPGRRAVLLIRASRGLSIEHPPTGPPAVAATLRRSLASAAEGLPEPAAGLIPGLAVGDTGAVGDELDAAMKASSLSHLTAVSGANCAIVVGLAFAAAALCGARRWIRVAAALCALAGFVLLVTPEPSVVRAAVMAAIAMLGVLLGRRSAGVSLLCAAVTTSLVADPWLCTSLGFGLSVAATGALLVLAAPLARGMSRLLPQAMALGLAVPLAAQLACGPLLVLLSPTVPLYGVAANLLAAPAAPVATVLGLAACVTAPLPVVASGLTALTWLPAAWIAATAQTAAALPASAVPWPEGVPGALALAVVGIAVAVLLLPHDTGRAARLARRLAAATMAVVVGVGAGGAALRTVAGPWTLPSRWAIAACDIGQGDALLVRSAGEVALIDTGPDPELLRGCLDRFGVQRIDLLVLTHYDQDHIGGLPAAVDRAVRVLHGPVADAADERMLAAVGRAGVELIDVRTGMSGTLGDAEWRVLWPRAADRVFASGNEASVTVDVRGGGVPSSIFLGDLDAAAQRALHASGALHPPYAVVKVARHGSADQSPDLYRTLGGTLALISVGAHNDYGHPRDATLAFLRADGYTIARTDRDGVVAVSADGELVRVWRERAPPGVGGPG